MKKLYHWMIQQKAGTVLAVGLFFLINLLSYQWPIRLDLTAEKRYSIDSTSRSIIRSLDDELELVVFLKGEYPSGFKKLATSTDEFLSLLQAENPSRFRYRFISPMDEVENGKLWGDSLIKLGALNINLTVQKKAGQSSNIIFPVALIRYKGQQSLVTLLPGASRSISQVELNQAEALMEHQFTSSIDKLLHPKRPGIAYETGHGEPIDERTYQLRMALQPNYELRTLDLTKQPIVPVGVDVLMIVKPSLRFNEKEKFKIDQFVMRGGKLICFLDHLYAEMDSFARKSELVAFDRDLNIEDLFFKYGARINPDLLMDLRCEVSYVQVGGTAQQPQNEFLPWNYFPLAVAPVADNKLKTAGYVSMRFANSIDTIQTPGVIKTPLLASSDRARVISTPALISLNENSTLPENKLFNRSSIPCAFLLEGQLSSLYRNRVVSSLMDSLTPAGMSFIPQTNRGAVILVGDGDIVLNDYIPAVNEQGQYDPEAPLVPTEMGWNKYTQFEYLTGGDAGRYFIPVANKEFLLNSVEYLVSNSAISRLRSKEIALRLLDGEKVKASRIQWQLITLLAPLVLLVLVAYSVLFWRKKQFVR
ncbi:MAG: gliding motility-associated ABC transporter substrate-binding protein GldG [Chitinophagaceae bacterium]|nr:gliding motility-associated ABC transporter substrate-binding protein GldG [Chitinophagaceae bacterium]